MAFANYVCWDMERIYEVMNANAELANREVFWPSIANTR